MILSLLEFAFSTSTTFISNISQSNGVISATKKKLPTFAGSSQPGIVSASEGLSENYLLNATGGWTAIDEELDATSTNPVQNKTLYNLETYHTLKSLGDGTYRIDDGNFILRNRTSVKLFFDSDLSAANDALLIRTHGNLGEPSPVRITNKGNVKIISGGPYSSAGDEETSQSEDFLYPHKVLAGFDTAGKPRYDKKFFKQGTVIELILTQSKWVIIGNLIVGRYEYSREYFTTPSWNITVNAVVYASGLKIQWGNFNPHSASGDAKTYFPVEFKNTPSMSFTFNTDNEGTVYYQDCPWAVSKSNWKLYSGSDNNSGTWIAIGY